MTYIPAPEVAKSLLSDTTPPAVAQESAMGTRDSAARADHTHASSVQAQRTELTLTNGAATWTFPQPFPQGVVPVVEIIAETPPGAEYRNLVSILQATNSGVQFSVVRVNQSVTLAAQLPALLGSALSLFAPQTGKVWCHCWARKPTT